LSYAIGFRFGHESRRRPGAVLIAVAALCILASGCNRGQATTARPVPEVEVATVETRDVPMYGEWVATLDGYVNAQIRPQVSGYIIRQNYKEGSLVHKGQTLFEIDPRPFQATLDRVKGDFAQAKAQLGKATLHVGRDTPEAEGRAIAKSQLDNEVQAKLGVQAAVESAKAAVEQAELNLEWTKVTSLVDGIAGIAQVQIGNLVGPESMLTSVSQVDPIKAFFPISEHEYLLAQAKGNAISYQQTIQQAFRGVSDSLVEYRKDREFREQQGQLVFSAQDAARLSETRYRGGATSYLEVLTSETNYFNAELGLARAQLNELLGLVRICRNLGGGWQEQ
jgi:RND family efflux transporter MFP subunit